MRVWHRWLLVWFLGVAALMAQAPAGFDPVKGVRLGFAKGAVTVTVPAGVHLKVFFMKVVKVEGPGTLTMGTPPPPTGQDEVGDGIWHGTVRVPVTGAGLQGTVKLQVTYQPCTEGEGGICFKPTTQTLDVPAAQIPSGVGTASKAPERAPVVEVPKAAPAPVPIEAPKTLPAPLPTSQEAPSQRGLWLALLIAFGAGLAASLTPCVYPMIPITMAIVGAKGSGRARGFQLSLALVLGMAVTYTTLGVVVARAGGVAGAFAQKPEFLFPVAALFALFALSLFGVFELRLPMALQNKLQGDGSRKGLGGAFLMGLVLGPLSAPCVGPIIGTVLVDIATKGDVVAGAAQLFVFALGMGVLFMAVGTFAAALPKSGDWLTRFKQGMGWLVLAYAAWSIRLLVPPSVNAGMWTLVALVGAGVFGAFEPAAGLLGTLRKAAGLLLLVTGLLLGLRTAEFVADVQLLPRGGAAPAAKPSLWLEQDLEGAKAKAKAEGKVVLVDVYADWCSACKELDEKTWPDAAVQAWIAKHAVAVRIDTDRVRKDLEKPLGIGSYPTVLVLDADGKELRRQLGFHPAPKMLAFLEGR